LIVLSLLLLLRLEDSVSTTDADHGFSDQDISARVVLKAYRQMLLFLFSGASSVIAILVVLIFVPYALQTKQAPPIPIFMVVVMAGTVGAFFSSLQRLYDFKQLPQILYDKRLGSEYGSLFVYSLVPPLVGGIAAAVLYLIFAGGMLSGAFFPAFNCKQGDCADFATLLADYGPAQAVDYAKAILWGFLAGFAERMVPNLLNHFAHDADKDDDASERDRPGLDRSQGDRKTGAASRVMPVEKNAVDAGDGPAPTMAFLGQANQN
jgi:hypothetical protein